jgi:catechol 2,3-dioxygenase-like lactoylglutathione lyase family enzyme
LPVDALIHRSAYSLIAKRVAQVDRSCLHDLVRVVLRTELVEDVAMLLDGFHHVAVLTGSTERFVRFYREVFGAEVLGTQDAPMGRLTFVRIGPHTEFNLFEVEGNTEAERQTPMFGRGRLDHFGLQAPSIENFDEIRQRLRDRGTADDFVTDFGPVLSMFFRDPDGLECEVCVANPDAVPGVSNPPGTRAARYAAEA